jgi:ubiquinone biosynthesis protein UbiJ
VRGKLLILTQSTRAPWCRGHPCAGAAAYNRSMLQRLHALVAPALASRLTLLLNHVLSAERVATERLVPHAGRTVALTLVGWPALLPPPPVLAWRITPAGLLEEAPNLDLGVPDLAVQLEASNPALLLVRAMAGEPAQVQVDGNAQLAGDVNWLMQNLRWDVRQTWSACSGPWWRSNSPSWAAQWLPACAWLPRAW